MTPKEKAQEIFDKYFEQMLSFGFHLSNSQINKFALITVDEIIDNIVDDDKQVLNYWAEVKQEIEQL